MPAAKTVQHSKFPVDHILYDDGDFSIAWGTYDSGRKCLGMRWNGDPSDPNDAGYPKLFKHPVWFVLPKKLSVPLLKGLLATPSAKNKAVLEVLGKLRSSGALKN
jgi:hypothetical protein